MHYTHLWVHRGRAAADAHAHETRLHAAVSSSGDAACTACTCSDVAGAVAKVNELTTGHVDVVISAGSWTVPHRAQVRGVLALALARHSSAR